MKAKAQRKIVVELEVRDAQCLKRELERQAVRGLKLSQPVAARIRDALIAGAGSPKNRVWAAVDIPEGKMEVFRRTFGSFFALQKKIDWPACETSLPRITLLNDLLGSENQGK